jgi:acetyl esterase/lipase
MRARALVLAVLLAAAAAGFAPGGTAATRAAAGDAVRVQGPFGQGAGAVWIYRPAHRRATGLVIFVHGYTAIDPRSYDPWLRHLAAQGNDVLYPRYQPTRNGPGLLAGLLVGVKRAVLRLDAKGLPAVAIGHSMGGRLAVEYAAVAGGVGLPEPSAIWSLEPAVLGDVDTRVNLGAIDPRTHILIAVGDRDDVVGSTGARQLLARLKVGGYPPASIQVETLRSRDGFVADHLAPLRAGAPERAEIWSEADRLIARVVRDARTR